MVSHWDTPTQLKAATDRAYIWLHHMTMPIIMYNLNIHIKQTSVLGKKITSSQFSERVKYAVYTKQFFSNQAVNMFIYVFCSFNIAVNEELSPLVATQGTARFCTSTWMSVIHVHIAWTNTHKSQVYPKQIIQTSGYQHTESLSHHISIPDEITLLELHTQFYIYQHSTLPI